MHGFMVKFVIVPYLYQEFVELLFDISFIFWYGWNESFFRSCSGWTSYAVRGRGQTVTAIIIKKMNKKKKKEISSTTWSSLSLHMSPKQFY